MVSWQTLYSGGVRLSLGAPGRRPQAIYMPADELYIPSVAPPVVLQAEFVTEIDFLDQLVGQDGLGVALGNQPALADDVGGFADIQGLAHVVIGDQHADALGLEMLDDLLDVADRDGVD